MSAKQNNKPADGAVEGKKKKKQKGPKGAGRKAKRLRYFTAGRREKNKERRVARDERRAKPMDCGHGSRHRSKYDGRCKRCYGKRK